AAREVEAELLAARRGRAIEAREHAITGRAADLPAVRLHVVAGVKASGVEHVRHIRLRIWSARVIRSRAVQLGGAAGEIVDAAVAIVVQAVAQLDRGRLARLTRAPLRELVACADLSAVRARADAASALRTCEATPHFAAFTAAKAALVDLAVAVVI